MGVLGKGGGKKAGEERSGIEGAGEPRGVAVLGTPLPLLGSGEGRQKREGKKKREREEREWKVNTWHKPSHSPQSPYKKH